MHLGRLFGRSMVIATALSLPLTVFAGSGEQRRAQNEIDAVGTALFSWLIDQVAAQPSPLDRDPHGAGSGGVCSQVSVDVGVLPVTTHATLEARLVPTYIAEVPVNDPWGFPYEYRVSASPFSSPFAAIRTSGSDGSFSGSTYGYGEVSAPTEDLVWLDGSHIRSVPLEPFRRQAVTVQDIGAVGTAIISWFTDQVALTGKASAAGAPVDLTDFSPISAGDLADLLVPNYILCVPELDRWGHPLEYWLDVGDLLGPEVTAIRSAGRDGTTTGDTYSPVTFPAAERDSDLVWADGLFVQAPEPDPAFFEDGFEGGDTCAWSSSAP